MEEKKNKRMMLFCLGVYCLFLLMLSTILFIGGSLSIYTSEASGVEVPFVSLRVAGFNVTVHDGPYDPGSEYGESDSEMLVIYAFAINNESEVDITLDMVFDITISYEEGYDETFALFKFIFIDETDVSGEFSNKEFVNSSGKLIDSIKVSTNDENDENSWGTIFMEKGAERTYVLVLDYSKIDRRPNKNPNISISGNITITASQVNGEEA